MEEGNKNIFNTYFFQDKGRQHGADSVFYDPYFVSSNSFKDVRTISRIQYGGIHCKTLRAVAQKAWIINTCITHTLRKAKPFLKPDTDINQLRFWLTPLQRFRVFILFVSCLSKSGQIMTIIKTVILFN